MMSFGCFADAPWSDECKDFAPTWDELAENFRDRDDVIIAKLDAIANEISDLTNVKEFPVIKFYPKNSNSVCYLIIPYSSSKRSWNSVYHLFCYI